MRERIRALSLFAILFGFANLTGSGWAQLTLERPLMKPEFWVQWMSNFPPVIIIPGIQVAPQPAPPLATSINLLPHISYVPADRDQGGCGNCWVWASTGCIEIGHSVLNGVLDRLSIQYFDSCFGGDACCGGNPGPIVTFYSSVAHAVPWADPGAAFVDGARGCNGPTIQPCGNITTTPSYQITSIAAHNIDTHSGQANAILNIKNILNQNKAVYFGFALPTNTAWADFQDFYFCRNAYVGATEATLWPNINAWCHTGWDTNTAGGHAIVLLGYDDSDANPANHYWLLLNSWGPSSGRPNNLLRIPQLIDYDCYYTFPGTGGYWAIGCTYFDVVFAATNRPPVAVAGGPYSSECAGAQTTVQLDGSASSDPDPGDTLTYAWTTDCPGAKFDNPSSAKPVLTVDASGTCLVSCFVTLTVTDNHGAASSPSKSAVVIADKTPPTITCSTNVTVCNNKGKCSAVVNGIDPGVSDACTATTLTYALSGATTGNGSGSASGLIFNKGATIVTYMAADTCGHSASCAFTVTVNDCEPPQVTCSVATSELGPPNHDLIGVGFVASATDNCDGTIPATNITVQVFSDEDELAPASGNFSPDAKNLTATGTLRLRAERRGDADGRVYLIVAKAADSSGNIGFCTSTVTVTHDESAADRASVNAQAAAATAYAASHNGAPPPGYYVIGYGPIVGPKQ
jgi:hypothetical protein